MKWNDELIQEVEAEIARMPEQTREIIQGVFFHGMKYQEVADQLGVSINTVKTLLKNGMRYLRERFAGRVDLFLVIALIKFYRKYLSPMKTTKCPYCPTCSLYGLEAVEKYGALKGGALALWRILRCNPFSKGGYDPVP